ncbi:MAG: PAS domain S-box protein [Salinivirgaceae bacterium]|nr:PAS domain S-box protein [Salinivirgaceae bacterium]
MDKKTKIQLTSKALVIIAITFLIVISIYGVCWFLIKKTYQNEKALATTEACIAVGAFEQHTAQIINQVDLILRSVRMDYLRTKQIAETQKFITELNFDTTIIEGIYMVNNYGTFIIPFNTNEKFKKVDDREYFQYHQSIADDNLFISAVKKGYISKKYSFRITRRINMPDGSFGGVVIVSLSPKLFTRYFQDLNIGSQNVAVLMGTHDNKLRAHIPEPSIDLWAISFQTPLIKLLQHADTGSFHYNNPVDNIQRNFKYKKVGKSPLVIVVGFSDKDVKNRIVKPVRMVILIGSISILFIIIIALIILKIIKVEADRKESEEKYHRIVDTAIEGICYLDKEARIIFINKQMAAMLGYSIKEMLGQKYNFYLSEDQLKTHETQMDMRRQGQDGVYEICFLRKDGRRNWILASATAVIDSKGKYRGSFAMCSDINKRKQLEEERGILIEELANKYRTVAELNATKNRFFEIIAHDLRGPLGSIMQIAEILFYQIDQLENEEKTIYLRALKEKTENVFSLLENLLEWALSQKGSIQPEYEKIDLKCMVEKTVQLFSSIAKNKNISIKLNLKGQDLIVTDPHFLATILRNLISNAIKFTKTGGTITINSEKQENLICISVHDTGIGMKREYIDKLFEKENNISTTGTSGEKGTGLGLLLCSELITKLNGKLEIQSVENIGTTFSFIVPASRS